MSAERELLKRLVPNFNALVDEASALLSSPEEEVVWAEGFVGLVQNENGTWAIYDADANDSDDVAGEVVFARIPVPRHLLHPEVIQGEVVEKEGKE